MVASSAESRLDISNGQRKEADLLAEIVDELALRFLAREFAVPRCAVRNALPESLSWIKTGLSRSEAGQINRI